MPALVEHPSAGAFLERAGPWLREREDHHNLILSLARSRAAVGSGVPMGGPEAKRAPEALFGSVEEGGRVVGCVACVAPYRALLTALPIEAAPAVGALLAERFHELPGIVGPRPIGLAVARCWAEVRGGSFREGMRQGLYRLESVVQTTRTSGRMRVAGAEDSGLARAWCEAFAQETGIDYAVTEATLDRWLGAGALWLWEVDGEAGGMAVAQGRTAHGIRIGFVYTPPHLRGRGHASGLVGALSQKMLDDGCAFCVLYTDLANPTSNAIYGRLGYEPIGEVVDVHLIASGAS